MSRPLGLLVLTAIAALAQSHPMALRQAHYEIRPGEPAALEAPADTVDFLLRAKTRTLSLAGFVAAPNRTGDQILLAPSPRTKPGEYHVTLSATSPAGEQRLATLDITVKPLVTVPSNSTRPPVVLLNGWELGFTGACPISTSSADDFGYLAQYLASDGVPVVYLFDNCAVDPDQPIEVLANDLSTFLNSIKYDSGAQVPQIDLVAFSLGGLVARAYLAGLQPAQNFVPPSPTLVHKLVLIATPNFGSFILDNYIGSIGSGTQDAELEPGSSFLWNLATWNQHTDDLRGTDTIAVIGNAGTYTASLTGSTFANASDGMVSLTSASAGFISHPVETSATRIVPYCHVDPSAYANTNLGSYLCNAPGIANVTDTSHYTGQIVRSFLAGNTAWTTIGAAPAANPYLSANGGMFFALQNGAGSYATDLTSVTFGTLALQDGGATETIFFGDLISGAGTLTPVSQSLGTVNCGSLTLPLGYTSAARCKIATDIFSVTPLAGSTGQTLAAGSTVTLTGTGFGTQCNGCAVEATPAGSSTAQKLTVTTWGATAISAKLPAGVTGLLTLHVNATAGSDSIGVFVATGSTIAATPAALQFACTLGATAPASQALQIANTGSGTLAWTATASASWLSLSATSGTAPSTPSVSITPDGLSAGTYNGTLQISATGASNSPVTVNVTLTVSQAVTPPSLAVAPQSIAFQYTAGSAIPAAQNVSIANPGSGGALSWTASADSSWLALSPLTGTTPGTLSIALNPSNLAAGTYTGNVTLTSATAGVTAVTLPVTLTVQGTSSVPAIVAAVNAASYQTGLAPATWISIFGTNLSPSTYTWQSTDFVNGNLPTSLQGVSVTIDGLPAYIGFISPTQINVLAPDDTITGPVQVQVTTAQQMSNAIAVQQSQFSPAFFTFANNYVAALHADYTPVSAASPARPGETILLYGTGFGPATPPQPTGQLVAAAAPLANPVTMTIGGQNATVVYAGLVESGTDQINVTVPNLPNGDAAVLATVGGVATDSQVNLAVQQ